MRVKSENASVDLERNRRLSQSLIWELQRKYFDDEGVNAFVGTVPFFVTSNQLIAKKYASCCLAFIQDWCFQNPDAHQHPFYFLELGTGCGQLSFYFLCHLTDMLERANYAKPISVRYVMTDFTIHNIKYWQEQCCLKKFIDNGILDFGLFDLERDTQITLIQSQEVLKAGSLSNPITVFGNYIFDSVSNDAFKVEDNTLHELLISSYTAPDNYHNRKIKSLDRIEYEFSASKIEAEGYYKDSALNQVLDFYQHNLNTAVFLMPITSLRSLSTIARFSHNKMLVLSSDKSVSSLHELESASEPFVAFHGSFSLDVNFDAMGRYVQYRGGSAVIPTPREGLRTVALGYDLDFDSLPIFNESLHYNLEQFPASSWYLIYRYLKENPGNLECKHLVSFFNLCEWDPYIFDKFINEIIETLPASSDVTQNELRVGLNRLKNNFYFMPKTFNSHFQVGLCFYHLGDFEEAIASIEQSFRFFGEQYHSVHCMALCYDKLGSQDKAQHYFAICERF